MRWMGMIVVAAALSGCSCHRSADPQASDASAMQAASASHPVNTGNAGDAPAASAPATDPNDAIALANYAQASATVQRYLGALPGAARADADALWTGGRPSPVPDDAALRAIGNIQSLRINNDTTNCAGSGASATAHRSAGAIDGAYHHRYAAPGWRIPVAAPRRQRQLGNLFGHAATGAALTRGSPAPTNVMSPVAGVTR